MRIPGTVSLPLLLIPGTNCTLTIDQLQLPPPPLLAAEVNNDEEKEEQEQKRENTNQ